MANYRTVAAQTQGAPQEAFVLAGTAAASDVLLSPKAKDKTGLRLCIRELAHSRPRFGYQRIHILLRWEGGLVGRNRVHRLYRLEGSQVRMRVRRRKRISLHRGPVPAATMRNEYWSMDFVHDQLANGRKFRVLTVIDKWSRESVLLETGFSLTGQRVVAALQRLAMSRRATQGNHR